MSKCVSRTLEIPPRCENWTTQLSNILKPYSHVHFYVTDPGAVAILKPFYEILTQEKSTQSIWFVEGWALNACLPNSMNISGLPRLSEEVITGQQKNSVAVLMGQQTDFERAYRRLTMFKDLGIDIIFVSDHWKDISGIFAPDGGRPFIMPAALLLPDQHAYDLQFSNLLKRGVNVTELQRSLKVFLHPGIERSLEIIESFNPDEKEKLRQKYNMGDVTILMALDGSKEDQIQDKHSDWKYSLDRAITFFKLNYSQAIMLVKPHPRQDHKEVMLHIQQYHELLKEGRIQIVEEFAPEPFIAICDEVWGMTSILLIKSLHLGKKVRAFPPAGTEAEGIKIYANLLTCRDD